ncbi:glycosyltransferase [Rhizobium sp. LjRoot254]|uniref:glycosyltransferase n=1 Tax=Rhizobium sp. LjRoot254 TaxID=3342297 RepID=UPI003ECE5301
MSSESAGTVAVAIACYNHGRFLAEAIESVLAQTCPASEIIVVDDGSADETEVVAKNYSTVTYVWQANQGLSSARNTGLRHARSDYILFLDADDLLFPNAIADSRACLEANPTAAFVSGGHQMIDAKGVELTRIPTRLDRKGYAGLLAGNHIAMHATVLYRRRLLLDAGGFDESLRACEDYDVYLRLSRQYPIAAYDSISTKYRRHESNMTGNPAHMLRYAKAVLQKHRPAAGGDPTLEKAWRTGWDFFEDFYGRELARLSLRRLARPSTMGLGLKDLTSGFEVDDHFGRRLAMTVKSAISSRVRRLASRRSSTP